MNASAVRMNEHTRQNVLGLGKSADSAKEKAYDDATEVSAVHQLYGTSERCAQCR